MKKSISSPDYSPACLSPLVSVVLLARTAADCKACLDMLSRQETTFATEVVVVDRTPAGELGSLCRRYALAYPHTLRYFRNPWRYLAFGRFGAGIRGRYVVVCRDSERWTDAHKLQRQGTFLREHPSCTLCFHNVYGDMALPRYDERLYDEGDVDFLYLLRHYSPLFRLEGTPGEYAFLLYERHGDQLFAHHPIKGKMQCLGGISSRVFPRRAVASMEKL